MELILKEKSLSHDLPAGEPAKKVLHKNKKSAILQTNRESHRATKEEVLLLQHLITADEADFVPTPEEGEPQLTPLEKLSAAETLNAKIKTTDFLSEITKDDETKITEAVETRAVEAFGSFITNAPDAKQKILELQLPEEVRSSVAMLSQYQWQFVKQAEELRSMAVAKIVKETDHPDARIRLKALDMLGKVTEVALFTERVEVKKVDETSEELDARIKAKLAKYMGIVDAVPKEIIDVDPLELPAPEENKPEEDE